MCQAGALLQPSLAEAIQAGAEQLVSMAKRAAATTVRTDRIHGL